jgi:mRNA-degrading endonuclease RelE of RelBE toxin-antitoxin system
MQQYQVSYTEKAVSDLKALDASIAKRITQKVEFYSRYTDPLTNAKMLSGNLQGLYRYRVGATG